MLRSVMPPSDEGGGSSLDETEGEIHTKTAPFLSPSVNFVDSSLIRGSLMLRTTKAPRLYERLSFMEHFLPPSDEGGGCPKGRRRERT